MTDLTHQQGATVIADYGFSYDRANRLKQLVTPDGTSDYTYNDRHELTSTDHSYQGDEAYNYDATGNRTDNITGDHNRLLDDGTYTYQYDNEGSRTRRVETATGEVTEYSWDHRNRLTKIETKDSSGTVTHAVAYTYDVYDRRITKSIDADGDGAGVATEENFVYDGGHIALVFDENGNQTQRYFHGPQIDQILAEETANGDTHWVLTDHQGSVRHVIDNSGTVLNHIVYDSFGQVTSETDPAFDFRFGYTGREGDEESGLHYYRARYFDPAVGTFVGEDPLGFAAGDSNLYRYVFNSPTNFTDPSGLLTLYKGNPIVDLIPSPPVLAPLTEPVKKALGQIPVIKDLEAEIEIDAGEGLAEDAACYWAEQYIDPNTPWYEKAFAVAAGAFSSLWMPENSDKTAAVVGAALAINAAIGTPLSGSAPKSGLSSPQPLNHKPKPPECFVAGTPVLTRRGMQAIEELRPGDWIFSWDEESGEIIERPVVDWFRRETPAIVDIFINLEKISCTLEHPFWVKDKGWVLASQLKAGSILQSYDGDLLVVDAVRRRDEVTQVYNVEIEDLHTYFVSSLAILSHNMCGGLENRGYRPNAYERSIQGQVEIVKKQAGGNPTVFRKKQDLARLRPDGHGQSGATATPLNVRNVDPEGNIHIGRGPDRPVTKRDIRELYKGLERHGNSRVRTRSGRILGE